MATQIVDISKQLDFMSKENTNLKMNIASKNKKIEELQMKLGVLEQNLKQQPTPMFIKNGNGTSESLKLTTSTALTTTPNAFLVTGKPINNLALSMYETTVENITYQQVETLITNGLKYVRDKDSKSLRHYLEVGGPPNICNEDGYNLLEIACNGEDHASVELLLKNGADHSDVKHLILKTKNSPKINQLLVARFETPPFLIHLEKGEEVSAQKAIITVKNPNEISTKTGLSYLNTAIGFGFTSIVEELLTLGANANLADDFGKFFCLKYTNIAKIKYIYIISRFIIRKLATTYSAQFRVRI